MRISGLASGIDTESMIKELMTAHRKPLEKIYQKKELTNWKIDAYREVNTKLLEYRKSMEDLRLDRVFNTSIASSSNPDIVSAISSGAVTQSSYEITDVTLAQTERAASVKFFTTGFDTNQTLTQLGINSDSTTGKIELTINNQNISLDPTMKLSDALAKISTDANMTVTYSNTEKSFSFTDNNKGSTSKAVISETTSNGSNFLSTLKMFAGEVSANTNTFGNSMTVSSTEGRDKTQASATINGIAYKSDTNSITVDGIQFELKGIQESTSPIYVTLKQDTDKIIDKIKTFVDGYNSLIEDLNGRYSERKNRDFPPLTSEQREAMSEKEVELWDKKAKAGLLGRDPILSKLLTSMRNIMSSPIQGADSSSTSPIDTLKEIGISFSDNYRDNGKLVIDEEKLKTMMAMDITKVAEVFNKSTSTVTDGTATTINNQTKFNESGVADRMYERLEAVMKEITSQALKGSQSVLGKQITSIDTTINAFEDRLSSIENRYWRQFTAMEKAIQQSNSQSAWLMQQLG